MESSKKRREIWRQQFEKTLGYGGDLEDAIRDANTYMDSYDYVIQRLNALGDSPFDKIRGLSNADLFRFLIAIHYDGVLECM